MDMKITSSRKHRKITLDMILASTSLTKSSKETSDAYLQRVTHLHLQRKKIKNIEGLDQCTNLKVLYLYENQIEEIKNLSFSSILSYLYLQGNNIKEIPTLALPNLKKLYLDDNEIRYVSGLQDCLVLEELHIARQKLPSFTALEFDSQSLHRLSRTLQVLEISGNGISILTSFNVLYNLKKLICQDNNIINFGEIEVVVSLPCIEDANFTGNPCCKLFRYRDVAIGSSSNSFHTLDGLAIPKHQHTAIHGLQIHRNKIGAISKFNAGINNNNHNINDSKSSFMEHLISDEDHENEIYQQQE